MIENEITGIIIDSAYKIHKNIGPGLLESVYQVILVYELKQRSLLVEAEVPIHVNYETIKLDIGFRADTIAENMVIVE